MHTCPRRRVELKIMALRVNSRVLFVPELRVCRITSVSNGVTFLDGPLFTKRSLNISDLLPLPDVEKEVCSICKKDQSDYNCWYAINKWAEGVHCFSCHFTFITDSRPWKEKQWQGVLNGGLYERNPRKH